MDDALLVRGFQRFGDLQRDAQRLLDRQRPTLQPLGQRLPLDQLHDQEVLAVRFLHPVKRGDVLVGDRGEHLGFAFEPRDAIRVGSQRLEDDLDGDAATELGVACAIDLAHPAGPEHVRDLVGAEPGAGGQWHGGGGL